MKNRKQSLNKRIDALAKQQIHIINSIKKLAEAHNNLVKTLSKKKSDEEE